MQYGLSQYLTLPSGMGFDGVQCIVVGRHESLDSETTYDVRWLDHHGWAAEATFGETRLIEAQRKDKKKNKKKKKNGKR